MPRNDLARELTVDILTDEEIVRRVLAGETALFELLMRRYNQRVYRTIRAVLRDEPEIEDAMQQAYVNAYRHLGQFAGDAQFSTWLLKIALHEAYARARRKRFAVAGDENVLAAVESLAPSPEEEASNEELRALLERQILALPESYRLVFVLRELDGLSTLETAEALGVSADVVKTRLHRARAMLQEALLVKAGVSRELLFAFRDTRCNRVVAAVLQEIARDVMVTPT